MAQTKVTLQFITEKSFGSAAIRWLTWSDYSHVDIVLPGGKLLGARMDGGVLIRMPNYAPFTKVLRLSATVDENVAKSIMQFAYLQLMKPYDKSGILNFALRDRNWREDDSWFCSELAAAAFQQAGYPLLRAVDVCRVTPRDLTISPLLTEER